MTEVTHQPCDSCGSSDAFSYNTEKGVGYCHSCGYSKKVSGKSNEVKQERKSNVNGLTAKHLDMRGLTRTTMEAYNVLTYVNSNGEPVEQHYPYPEGHKVRFFPKSFKASAGFKSDQLFGMDKFPSGSAKAITITEGEVDALSAFQMLGSKYPAVALPSATPSSKLFSKCKDYLDGFDKIYCSFDNDGKSDAVLTALAALFPNRVYSLTHGELKDANDFLTSGKAAEYKACWWNARKFVPDNVFNSTEDFLSIFRDSDDSSYLPTGIQQLDDTILGLMRGHFTVFQAPEGIGKTEFMRFLEYNILSNHKDVPIAICHMEEVKKRSLLGLVSYHLKQNFTRQDLITEAEATDKVEQAITDLTENENLFQFSLGVDDDPLVILDRIRYFATACGCQYVFFEPIQDLGYSRTDEGTLESFLSGLSTKLMRLASELNIGIITIAHENDEGQVRDCRMISKRASVVIKLQRDKLTDDPVARNTTDLIVTKNRPTGQTGKAGCLYFNEASFTLEEKTGDYETMQEDF